MPKILVTAKVNPDIDGTACLVAYADLLSQSGRSAEGFAFGQLSSEAEYFVQHQGLSIPTHFDDGLGDWSEFVLVDMSSAKGLPKVVKAEKVTEAIDHRSFTQPEKEFPTAYVQNELVGAAATLIVERFLKSNLRPQKGQAQLLYGALFENTLNFLSTNTTERDHQAARWLEKEFSIHKGLSQEMFKFSTLRVLADLNRAIELDAQEFEGFSKEDCLHALQLTLFGFDFPGLRSQVEEVVLSLEKGQGVLFSFLNIVDLEKARSYLFASNERGVRVIEQALGANFEAGWAVLAPPILRKQIIPKVIPLVKSIDFK